MSYLASHLVRWNLRMAVWTLLVLCKCVAEQQLGREGSSAVLLPSSIRDVLSAQGAGFLQMHDNEVILHALYDLPQAAHDLLVDTATPIPLALHAQIGCYHMELLVLDHSRHCPKGLCCCKVSSGAKIHVERTHPHAWHCYHDGNSSSQLLNAADSSS